MYIGLLYIFRWNQKLVRTEFTVTVLTVSTDNSVPFHGVKHAVARHILLMAVQRW